MIQPNTLQNKRVVVTGGATGIGFAIANLFAQSGAKVAIGSRRESAISCLLYTSPSPRDGLLSRMPSSA